MATVYAENEEFHLKIRKGDVGRYVLLCGDPGRCLPIAEYFDTAEHVVTNREYTIYTGTLAGEKISVCSTGIGGPSTAIAMEELIHCGADTFIRVGTSGGMHVDAMSGDVVIGTGAIRMEGTTREYAPIEYPAVPDYRVLHALVEAAKEENRKTGQRYHTGVLQCKDSFYGQHSPQTMPVSYELQAKWEAWVKLGAMASEMESAAIFIVGSARGVRTGSIMTVLANQTRRELRLSDSVTFDVDAAIRIGVRAMGLLIEEDRN